MTDRDFIKFWINSASEDWKTAEDLLKLKRYHHSLFFCHLAIEKVLKGLIYKTTKNHAAPIHDLLKLAEQAKLIIEQNHQEDLREITSWNIQTRYDSYKLEFYKKSNKKFTHHWFLKAKEIYLWLKNQF